MYVTGVQKTVEQETHPFQYPQGKIICLQFKMGTKFCLDKERGGDGSSEMVVVEEMLLPSKVTLFGIIEFVAM